MDENQDIDKKSLKLITGSRADWNEIAKVCVCFANSRGGILLIGIEDNSDEPPARQRIDQRLLEKLHKTIPQLSHNVGLRYPEIKTAPNGGQYIELNIYPSVQTIACTSNGRYYIRISDSCKPVLPEQMTRLAAEKNAFIWELQTTRRVPKSHIDDEKLKEFLKGIRTSDRVSKFVTQKDDDELIEHYMFVRDGYLTNLGILWIGKREDRASLLYAPSIQFIRYNEREQKIKKEVFDDHSLNPLELIEVVWNLSDWNEATEISSGFVRDKLPVYDRQVVRELVANALVHRPYVMAGDIYVNLFTDRLEVHNPGLLPFGVTPTNILHQSVRRNDHLAKVFYDLKLMEREGSGFDKIYEVLVAGGKPLPVVNERDDRVVVTVFGRVINPEIVRLMDKVSKDYQLKQKELITLGIIAQHNALSANELSHILELKKLEEVRTWLGQLTDIKLVLSRGRTKGTEYFVNPEILRKLGYKGKTTLKQIESHRLRELILVDLKTYPNSSVGEIHERIGKEIPIRKLQHELYQMVSEKLVTRIGVLRHTRYSRPK